MHNLSPTDNTSLFTRFSGCQPVESYKYGLCSNKISVKISKNIFLFQKNSLNLARNATGGCVMHHEPIQHVPSERNNKHLTYTHLTEKQRLLDYLKS